MIARDVTSAAPRTPGASGHSTRVGERLVALRDAEDPARFGAKAARQSRMSKLGLSVPDGFVVPADVLAAFLEQREVGPRLGKVIEETLSAVDHGDPRGLRTASEHIAAQMRAGTFPEDLREAVSQLCDRRTRWIVRSSAVGEDGLRDSFAGQLTSIPDVRTAVQMERAILECWASTWSVAALSYQHHRAATLSGTAVLIQRQVSSSLSGVLFTVAPPHSESVRPSDMLCEFVRGHGAGLVDGDIDPVRVAIDRRGSGLRELARPAQETAALSGAQAEVLRSVGRELEDAFGSAQDIEWTIDAAGDMHFVQSRPVTTSAGLPLVEPAEPSAQVVWSNANVCENFPEAISPLLYSVARDGYYHYFRNLALAFGVAKDRVHAEDGALRHLVGVHQGRIYYNLTNIHSVLRLVPGGEFLIGSFDDFVGAESIAGRDPVGATRGHRFKCWLGYSKILRATSWQFLFLSRRVEQFESRIREFAEEWDVDSLARSSKHDLRRALRGFLDIRFHHWIGGSLADAAAMVSYGALRRFLSAHLPDAANLSHNSALTGLQDVVSAEPVRELWRLSRLVRDEPALTRTFAEARGEALLARIEAEPAFAAFRGAFASYLREWGFRRSGELMLTVPSLEEDPSAAIELIRPYLEIEGESPDEVLLRQAKERRHAVRRIDQELARGRWFRAPLRRLWSKTLIRQTRKSIRLRERARMHQALLYNRCRRIVLEMGARLVESGTLSAPEDAFWFSYGELDEFLAGASMFPHEFAETAERRRRCHAELASRIPPDHFEVGRGRYFDSSVDKVTLDETEAVDVDGCLTGTGASGGRTTARAAVLRDLGEVDAMQRGDVLVAPQTDPGWAPLFFLASGLVLERGGMLSHGAILAREYGIPTVVGVAGAMRTIQSGDLITVDGDRGRVHVSDS